MVTKVKPIVEDVLPAIAVIFSEDGEGNVTAQFQDGNIGVPFSITLQNMNWGLVEDLEHMGDEQDTSAILRFFHDYVAGGPKAIPFKHTLTVFQAIRAYIEQSIETLKNV